jgi:signal transduction histidine kinase/AmiR/NasT family two-component response regulator/HPt (histidine-containing phosphotransfer) domain-containing protein
MQDGRAVRLTGAFQDVTHSVLQRLALQDRAVELQHSNAELDRLARHMDRARKDAEQASRAKTRFLAGMSHELRTPLNGILGYAQLLRMDGGLTPLQAQRVHAMLRAGTHLLDMISCVLDLSEIETQSVEPQCSKLDVIELAEACVAILRPQAEAKGLSIGLSVQAGLPRHIMGDAPRLRQVLLNLLGNAVKYTSAGSVALRVGVAEAGDPSEGERLRFDVRDTGPGIPPEKRYRLFEEFERLGAGGAGGQEGAGLGLYLAKRLTALLRGTIGHDDNPGGGSVFWLTLPLVACGEQRDAAGAAPDDGAGDDRCGADGGGQLPILVVDDVAINRDIAASFIRSAGHVVVCAADGAQAVEMAASGAYRLIFMDVRMPGIDGLEATRRIRALDGPAADVPIVALTAQAFTEQIEACRQAGMDTHLAKPFTLETLLGAIDRGVEAGRRRARAQKPALLGSDLPVLNAASYALTASCLSPAMMATYVNGVVGQITALQSRLAGGAADDAESLAEAAHVLAGSAGMFGCERLVFVAKHFEASIMADPGQAAILSDGLQGALSATVPAMRGRLEAA